MILRYIKSILLSAIFLHVSSLSLLACSYADGSLPSTKYDLIKETEAILLAQPISKTGNSVDFNVLEVLKGDFQGKEFHGEEMHTSCEDYSFSVQLQTDTPTALELKFPKLGPKYVLFLKKTKNGWSIWSHATDAMNEPIVDVNSSTFLTAVKHFIHIGSKNNYDIEKSELKKLRELARGGRKPREYPKELIELIDDHLDSPTPSKSFADLVSLYSKSPERKQRQVLWAFAWGKHKEAASFFTTLLKSPIPLNYIGPISEYITQTKNIALLVRLGKDYPNLEKGSRWPLMWALIKTADERHVSLMLAALKSADKEEAGRLAEWFVRYPVNEATEIVRDLVGKAYQENWELTFNLAGMGDVGTLDWAREFMNSHHKDRWMAYYTIAYSPLDDADTLARIVIEGNDPEGLTSLIQGYGDSQNPNRWNRLRDVINLKDRDPDVDSWLRRTLEEMADKGDTKSGELLKSLQE